MKKKYIYSFAAILLVILFFTSILVGRNNLNLSDILAVVAGEAGNALQLTIFELRLPRTILAILGGAGLGAAGYLLQGVTRNDLADASLLGINSGAGFFVLIYLGFFAQGNGFLLPLLALIGGLVAVLAVYGIAYQSGPFLALDKLLLAGVAVNAGFGALTLLGTIKVAPDRYRFVTNWLAGSLWGANWSYVLILCGWLMLLIGITLVQLPYLDLLQLNDEQALSIGIEVRKVRLRFLFLGAAIAASCVAFCGNLAFVGLLAPHITKRLLKGQASQRFPLSLLIGSLIVLTADTIGRILLTSGELPAGVMIAICGAPYFLVLLVQKPRT
ncbi:FecCD family ABC transporter permease [Enterococcus dispar]|uniref:FecCD family ABC transporter permease n=1 Tax=Enterococcus dispar TaxID=44009 RepID=UPI002890403A|nr:iron ABC transporter permease [Enterococcus dispar]MDT2704691.1 iron ABC transporter permease [Enterococcus dispar]